MNILNFSYFSIQEKRMSERRQQYKAISQHLKGEDETRTQAYGWSILGSINATAAMSIPVPVCCRPLLDRQPSLKVYDNLSDTNF